MSLKKNVIANYLGQGWAGLIGLAFVPLYIKYLGIEAYGLIGIFALLQAWLTLLDMGMTPTLNREMARFTAGAHTPQSIRDLLRSLEIICFGVATLIGVLIWAASGWLASDWLRADKLPLHVVAQAIAIMGGVAALRFVEGIYRGAILGLQRQVFFNVVNASLSTVRAAGAIAVLAWISPTIEAYFVWQGLVSILSIVVFALASYGNLPPASEPVRFSPQAIMAIRNFAGGLMATTFLSILLTQADKVLLSKLVSLGEFGYYALAGSVVSAIYLLITPITQAFYPRFTTLVSSGAHDELVKSYHLSAQLVTVSAGPIAVTMILFGQNILELWIGNSSIAKAVAPILTLLAVGTFLNGLMHIPYMLQLANGWSMFAARMNLVAVAILVPAIIWVTPIYGAIGAAWIWLILNVGYLVVGVHYMFRRLLPKEKSRWFIQDIFIPISPVVVSMSFFWFIQPLATTKLAEIVWLISLNVISVIAASFAAPATRNVILGWLFCKSKVI